MKYKNVSTDGVHNTQGRKKRIAEPGKTKFFKIKGEFVSVKPGEVLDTDELITEKDLELIADEPIEEPVKKEPVKKESVKKSEKKPKVKESLKDKIVDIVEDIMDDGKLNNSNKKPKKKEKKKRKFWNRK